MNEKVEDSGLKEAHKWIVKVNGREPFPELNWDKESAYLYKQEYLNARPGTDVQVVEI